MKRYDVEKWATEFLNSLKQTKQHKDTVIAKLTREYEQQLVNDFHQKRKIIVIGL